MHVDSRKPQKASRRPSCPLVMDALAMLAGGTLDKHYNIKPTPQVVLPKLQAWPSSARNWRSSPGDYCKLGFLTVPPGIFNITSCWKISPGIASVRVDNPTLRHCHLDMPFTEEVVNEMAILGPVSFYNQTSHPPMFRDTIIIITSINGFLCGDLKYKFYWWLWKTALD